MFQEVRNAMTTTMKRHKWSRGAGLGLAAILLLVLSGDGIGAAISPHGIDPLDVLDLQVKPNVIIVLDSSGSMQESLGRDSAGNSPAWNADWVQAKMSVAKTVLSTTIQANASKASFLFGQYTQNNQAMQQVDLAVDNRFLYLTAADATTPTASGLSPTMLTACAAPYTTACELTMNREPGNAFGNSITTAEHAISGAVCAPTPPPFPVDGRGCPRLHRHTHSPPAF
jgi:hypothetical protein